jgi:hypothetical protein
LKLDISHCDLYVEGTKLLAEGLTGNQVMTELNISANLMTTIPSVRDGEVSGVVAIADAIKDMRALSTFTFSGNSSSEPVTMETTMTEADFSDKELGVSGGMMVAAFLPKCQ